MNTKYCKAQLTAPQSIFVFTFFRQQITKSALGYSVLKLEVSLCEVSSWFWGKSLCRAPHWVCLSPLPLLTSCSNLRTQGSQNLCWEPRLNAQLLILLTVANRLPSEAQRPETTPEEKAVTGSLLYLPLFGIWHQLFDFLQSLETVSSASQAFSFLQLMQMPRWSWGGGSVIKAPFVSVKPGVWIPRIHINSRWAWHPAHYLIRQREDPQNNLASKTNHIGKLRAWLKDLTSKKKMKSSLGWFLTWTSAFHIHSHPCAHAPTHV